MNLVLARFASAPTATFGRLLAPGFSCFTVERPWADNRRWISCIPVGTYPLRPARFVRGGYNTLEVTGVPGRSAILIHKGNLPTDVQGCVALGTGLGVVDRQWAVTGSAAAWAEFEALVVTPWDAGKIEVRYDVP